MLPIVSVVLCTRDPVRSRLARTLAGLSSQMLPSSQWELLLIDNGSTPSISTAELPPHTSNIRVIVEPVPGLTAARLRGIAESRSDVIVFVDDDNVLAPNYLSDAHNLFTTLPRLGAAGGPVHPEFATPPASWITEFHGLLALHNHGVALLMQTGAEAADWPTFAPVGAGLCIRKEAARHYVEALNMDTTRRQLDRRGASLASGGDNDLVFTILHNGWDVGYFPTLTLRHLIPSERLTPAYLARLNRGIQRSWVHVLSLHGKCGWPAIPRWSVPLRVARAWLRSHAWRSPVHRIRWAGLRGRLEGQADLSSLTKVDDAL